MLNTTTILGLVAVAMAVVGGGLFEARKRYQRMRMDQRFCQLSRNALL